MPRAACLGVRPPDALKEVGNEPYSHGRKPNPRDFAGENAQCIKTEELTDPNW